MGLLAAAALLAATSGDQQYPVTDILSAARKACDVALASNDPAKELSQDGWTPAVVKPRDWIDRSLREERAMFGPDFQQSSVMTMSVFGRSLFAFVNTLRPKGLVLKVCSVQDPMADIQSAPDRIISWAGRAPTSLTLLDPALERGFNEMVFKKNWKPGLNNSADNTTIIYVPRKFSGVNGGLTYTSERSVGPKSE